MLLDSSFVSIIQKSCTHFYLGMEQEIEDKASATCRVDQRIS